MRGGSSHRCCSRSRRSLCWPGSSDRLPSSRCCSFRPRPRRPSAAAAAGGAASTCGLGGCDLVHSRHGAVVAAGGSAPLVAIMAGYGAANLLCAPAQRPAPDARRHRTRRGRHCRDLVVFGTDPAATSIASIGHRLVTTGCRWRSRCRSSARSCVPPPSSNRRRAPEASGARARVAGRSPSGQRHRAAVNTRAGRSGSRRGHLSGRS